MLDYGQLLVDYNKKYKGKKTDKNELNKMVKYYSNIANRTRFDLITVNK